MEELTGRQSRHLDYLLADYSAIKAEIARRSNLQRVVLGAFVAVLAVVFQQAATVGVSSLWVASLWASSALALQFYAREGLEIARLAALIRGRIAPVAAEILDLPVENLLPSETNPEIPDTRDMRVAYNSQFNWALFFAAPMLITLLYIGHRFDRWEQLPTFATSRCTQRCWSSPAPRARSSC